MDIFWTRCPCKPQASYFCIHILRTIQRTSVAHCPMVAPGGTWLSGQEPFHGGLWGLMSGSSTITICNCTWVMFLFHVIHLIFTFHDCRRHLGFQICMAACLGKTGPPTDACVSLCVFRSARRAGPSSKPWDNKQDNDKGSTQADEAAKAGSLEMKPARGNNPNISEQKTWLFQYIPLSSLHWKTCFVIVYIHIFLHSYKYDRQKYPHTRMVKLQMLYESVTTCHNANDSTLSMEAKGVKQLKH